MIGLAAAGALVTGLAACDAGDGGNGDGDGDAVENLDGQRVGAMDDYGVGDTFVATEEVTFDLLYRDHPNYPLDRDWLFFQSLAERNNVQLDPTVAPLSDWDERRSLLIGAGNAPSFIPVTYGGQEAPFVASGAILPVSEYVDLMPHFQDKVERWGLQEELDSLRQEDGHYYLLPGLLEQVRPDYTLAMRTDVLDDLGVAEPTSWDEVREAFEEIADEHDGYPFSDRWEGQALLNYAAASFGTAAGWGYGQGVTFDHDAGEFLYTGATDEYRQLVEYFAGLVEDGLMDPESFTQDDDQALQKLSNENSYAVSTNAQELIGHRNTLDTAIGEGEYEIGKVLVPAGPAGDIIGGTRLESGIMISARAAEQDTFVAMMQFIDWLYYSDEGLEFAKWGVEGETFERSGDTGYTLTEDVDFVGLNPDGSQNLQADFGFFNGVFLLAQGSTHELVLSHLNEEEVEWQEAMAGKQQAPIDPPYPLSEMEREQASLYQNALNDFVQQSTLQFILGQRDLDTWDAYVAELEGMNMTAYVDVVNEAHQRFLQNN
ncbi:ABC transporter substrate-binding protein [Cellulomonas bogoriensis]|uniref:ABC transporter substrate-binding protein n=1 Tax=Cellulomonas bogoriensis TaxID=301388 RepID=UPI000AB691AC|nr:extracellular solute-binding protein [Cellulomonas bogoriensis]